MDRALGAPWRRRQLFSWPKKLTVLEWPPLAWHHQSATDLEPSSTPAPLRGTSGELTWKLLELHTGVCVGEDPKPPPGTKRFKSFYSH